MKFVYALNSSNGASKRQRQKGMSLIQALFVLVLGGIALSVALNQYQSGEKSSRVQKNVGDVMEIVGQAKSNYGQYSYKNLTTEVAVKGGVIPSRLADTATTAKNDFGGDITLIATAPADGTATLTFTNILPEMCTQLVAATAGSARLISVGGTVVKPMDGELNMGTLSDQCTAAASAAVVWVIGRT